VALTLLATCACATPGTGLRPLYVSAKSGSSQPTDITSYSHWWFGWAQSLQPTLRWEAFPRPSEDTRDQGQIANVTCDLRIWRASPVQAENRIPPVELVYAREGLAAAEHTVAQPLAPGTYVWSVRARFELSGAPRVTEWGGLKEKSRLPIELSPWRYRFVTPPARGGAARTQFGFPKRPIKTRSPRRCSRPQRSVLPVRARHVPPPV